MITLGLLYLEIPPLIFFATFWPCRFCVENFDLLCKDISLFFYPHNAGGFPSLPRICLRTFRQVGWREHGSRIRQLAKHSSEPPFEHPLTITKHYARPFPSGFDRFFRRLQFQCDSGGMRAFADQAKENTAPPFVELVFYIFSRHQFRFVLPVLYPQFLWQPVGRGH